MMEAVIANQWTGFYMITASIKKELKKKLFNLFDRIKHWALHVLFFYKYTQETYMFTKYMSSINPM